MSVATNDDIHDWFKRLKLGAHSLAGADLDKVERDQARILAETVLNILESVVIDINNIAFYLGEENTRRNNG